MAVEAFRAGPQDRKPHWQQVAHATLMGEVFAMPLIPLFERRIRKCFAPSLEVGVVDWGEVQGALAPVGRARASAHVCVHALCKSVDVQWIFNVIPQTSGKNVGGSFGVGEYVFGCQRIPSCGLKLS